MLIQNKHTPLLLTLTSFTEFISYSFILFLLSELSLRVHRLKLSLNYLSRLLLASFYIRLIANNDYVIIFTSILIRRKKKNFREVTITK